MRCPALSSPQHGWNRRRFFSTCLTSLQPGDRGQSVSPPMGEEQKPVKQGGRTEADGQKLNGRVDAAAYSRITSHSSFSENYLKDNRGGGVIH